MDKPHTPGPWTYGQDQRGHMRVFSPAGREIVRALSMEGLRRLPKAEREANARLIASAPALAAEVERLRGELAETHQRYDANLADCAIENMEMEAEVERLREALKGLTDLYAYIWDRADDALVLMPHSIPKFEAAHAKAVAALARQEATK